MAGRDQEASGDQLRLDAFAEPDAPPDDADSDGSGLSERELECLKKANEQLAKLEEYGAGDPIWTEELGELKPKTQLLLVAKRVEAVHDDLEEILGAWCPENREQRGYY